jgi:hypothetical protein
LGLFASVVRVRLVETEGVGARIILKWYLEMNCKCLNCVWFLHNAISLNAVVSLRVA